MELEEGERVRVDTGEMDLWKKLLLCSFGIVVLLLIIILPLGFVGIEYYELGFTKQKSTGRVNLDEVYTGGRYFIGPDFTFKTFPAEVHFEEMNEIAIFSKDKVEVEITCAMQYFLRPEDLKDMHQEYDLFYKPVVRTTAIAAIKGQATQLSISQFIRERSTVEEELFKAAKTRLEGTCCRKDCSATNCVPGCIQYSNCTSSQKGMFVEVRYFQFLNFDIHDDVKSRYLRQVTEREQEERAQYELGEKVVRKETERQKNEINNQAAEIAQNATAEAKVIQAKAEADALLTVEAARDRGLSFIYSQLNITSQQHKSALNYLRTLRGKKNFKFNVGYTTLMAKD